ncbi:MAG: disulfide bond formation protein B [Novosphingobium sp.]|jgi:disulfide bond formation protein DsbB|uniref:disulfide bond formation protein B n=1 Tax=Novosphingobium sp. TaxID=1874826 RepID=UPI003919E735|nr:disulfide bond formation protein B [Novosphingobium sp.]
MAISARVLALAVPGALLGGAYISQYGFGLYPCEMCWWQRYPHFAALVLAAIGLLQPRQKLWPLLAGLAILVSGLIGAFHAGVEYGWWEGITGCATVAQSGGDPLAAILDAPIVRCDVAPWTLLGISLAGFNFLISTAGALAIFILLRREGTKA